MLSPRRAVWSLTLGLAGFLGLAGLLRAPGTGETPGARDARSAGWEEAGRRRALAELEAARREAAARGDGAAVARSLLRIAEIRRELGEAAAALALYESIDVAERRRDAGLEIDRLTGLAHALLRLDRPARAREAAAKAAASSRAIHDRRRESAARIAEGLACQDSGEPEAALEAYLAALRLRQVLGSPWEVAEAWRHVGFARSDRGEETDALRAYEAALAFSRLAGDVREEALTLTALGHAYSKAGEKQRALDAYMRAAPVIERMGDPYRQASLAGGIGFVYDELGDWETAAAFYQKALALNRKTSSRWGEAANLVMLGRTQRFRGRPELALATLDAALRICANLGDRKTESIALTEVGMAQVALARTQPARELFQRSLELSRRIGFKRQEAVVLEELGAIALDEDRMDEASGYLDRALTLSRAIEFPLGEARALFHLARLELAKGSLDGARLRAEAALDITRELRGNVRDQTLRISFSESVRALHQLEIDVLMTLHGERPREGFDALAFEAYERARARSLRERLSEPRRTGHAAPKQAPPVSLRRIQAQLGRDTLLLAYHLGEVRSYLWAVTADDLTVYQLPLGRVLDSRAREAYELLTPPSRMPPESAKQYEARVRVREAAFEELACSLSRDLLGPVADRIADRRLVIVGDGALHYIPFSALPAPGTAPAVPLVARHEIVRLPSSSTLVLLSERARSRPPPPRTLAVLADPVFDGDDPRVGDSAKVSPSASWELRELPFGTEATPPRLLASRQEARAIVSLVPPDERLQALGFDANRALVTSGELGLYRTVHFATHGILNGRHPDFSGIILSLVDADGNPEDGFLALPEVYDLDLPVELVVLSACSTALGKETKAEGLIGLARGFLLAGASSVIASYWNVDDEATAEFMSRFYRYRFSDALGASAALRATQRSMLEDRRFRAPRYWAAFELHGKWR